MNPLGLIINSVVHSDSTQYLLLFQQITYTEQLTALLFWFSVKAKTEKKNRVAHKHILFSLWNQTKAKRPTQGRKYTPKWLLMLFCFCCL